MQIIGLLEISFLLMSYIVLSSAYINPAHKYHPTPPNRLLSHKDGEDYDKYGCCLSCGEFYCHSSKKCISDWDDCNLGSYDASTNNCKFTFKNARDSFTYSLGDYALPRANYYEVTDEVSHPSEVYRYYFNLCKHVETRNLPSVCSKTYGSGSESCEDSALAFQYTNVNSIESCYRMSDCNRVINTDQTELGLLDPVEPASGVYVKYYGGNTCPNSYSDKEACYDVISKHGRNTTYCARSFKLNIKCHDEIKNIPEREKVEEVAGCSYEVTINHKMGCPVECPRHPSTKRVCSGRGLCFYSGYDDGYTIFWRKSRGLECVCQSGYTGDACESYSLFATIAYQSGVSVWFVVLIFLILFAALVIQLLKHKDKLKLLLRGEFEAVFPALFGRRAANDGKGFYSRVDESSAGYDPYSKSAASRQATPPMPSPTSNGRRKDVQLAGVGGNPFSESESFTL